MGHLYFNMNQITVKKLRKVRCVYVCIVTNFLDRHTCMYVHLHIFRHIIIHICVYITILSFSFLLILLVDYYYNRNSNLPMDILPQMLAMLKKEKHTYSMWLKYHLYFPRFLCDWNLYLFTFLL